MARELVGYFGPDATDDDIADAIIAAHQARKAKANQTAAKFAESQQVESDRKGPGRPTVPS
jgi:hypothetical protein